MNGYETLAARLHSVPHPARKRYKPNAGWLKHLRQTSTDLRRLQMELNPLTLVQLNFRYCPPDQDVAQEAAWERAHAIAQVSGLHWKLWIFNPDTQAAGGIYLFNNEVSANAYLNGPIVEGIKQMAGVENLEAKLFSVNPMLSQLTHAQLPN